jgi:hypothetical protein
MKRAGAAITGLAVGLLILAGAAVLGLAVKVFLYTSGLGG